MTSRTYIHHLCVIILIMLECIYADDIEIASCPPPNYPAGGGYGPQQSSYSPGDIIHYYCNTDTFIAGNYLRICLDSGDWTGETPFCDLPVQLTQVSQTSTVEPAYKNDAQMATDGSRTTCSSTEAGENNEWTASFPEVSQVLRFMLFLPTGQASYETFVVKPDGSEFSCGGSDNVVERYDWTIHNCLAPNNLGITGIKIKSKSAEIPLRLCEVVVHVLSDPTCPDPRVYVANGQLVLTRKTATLECYPNYRKATDRGLECIRTGVWTRRSLYCELATCPPPDYPASGGYGPIQPSYLPGDSIHYFCNTYSYIGGNYYRRCLDSGDWTGDTPVCDFPVVFDDVSQTSTAEPAYKNEADSASDGSKTTCSSTKAGKNTEWTATFPEVSHVIRVMLFLPLGDASYEIFVARPDGSEFSCGSSEKIIDRYEWVFHNCLEPNNTGMIRLRIRSKSEKVPLRLCEVVAHVLTDPTCVDPHFYVENGRLILSRKEAELECDPGARMSRATKLECIRTGVWTRKPLYCRFDHREAEIAGRSPNMTEQVGSSESES